MAITCPSSLAQPEISTVSVAPPSIELKLGAIDGVDFGNQIEISHHASQEADQQADPQQPIATIFSPYAAKLFREWFGFIVEIGHGQTVAVQRLK